MGSRFAGLELRVVELPLYDCEPGLLSKLCDDLLLGEPFPDPLSLAAGGVLAIDVKLGFPPYASALQPSLEQNAVLAAALAS